MIHEAPVRILVVGSGSREHALVSRLSEDGHDALALPGNAGTPKRLDGKADDVANVVAAAKRERVDLVVVGPEAPLVAGLVDALAAAKIPAFGPSRRGAVLEGSKAFMKRFLQRHAIPTAAFEVFDEADAAEAYVRAASRPLVVKTDGLAAGKGVVVAKDTDEALAAVRAAMRDRVFGDAGETIVIEEVLPGEEASFHVISDGERWLALPAAQDHKRVRDGDEGPNTGGMGAYAPAPVVTEAIRARVEKDVIEPALRGMREEGARFRGVLFVGLMIHEGVASVLEFNVRFGDPEACVLIPLIDGDLGELLYSASIGKMPANVATRPGAALAVVMASEGYPAKPKTGDAITFGAEKTAHVFHAGTKRDETDAIVTSGGRVLAVTAVGEDLATAHARAYEAVAKIHFRGEHHRTDIGNRALRANMR
jgi:phosphoribosylamine--glycine ligase